MGKLLTDAACKSCDGRHDFWLGFGDLMPSRAYGYTCPATGSESTLKPTGIGVSVEKCPATAVAIVASSRYR
jgi:hypothetical protein